MSGGPAAPKACEALRSDAPQRLTRQRGALPDLSDPARSEGALAELDRDMFSASARASNKNKLQTVTKALAFFGYPLLPMTVDKIRAVGAALKKGHYASAASYLYAYKGHVERLGHNLSAAELRMIRDSKRSAERGLGGPVKARSLPFERLHELSGDRAPLVKRGPLSPRNAIVAGSWFLTREVELSTARAAMVEFTKTKNDGLVAKMAPTSIQDGRPGSGRSQVSWLFLLRKLPVPFVPSARPHGPAQVLEEGVSGQVDGRQAQLGPPTLPDRGRQRL